MLLLLALLAATAQTSGLASKVVSQDGYEFTISGDEFDAVQTVRSKAHEIDNTYSWTIFSAKSGQAKPIVALVIAVNQIVTPDINSGTVAFASFRGGERASITVHRTSRGCFSVGCGYLDTVVINLTEREIANYSLAGSLDIKVVSDSELSRVVSVPSNEIRAAQKVAITYAN